MRKSRRTVKRNIVQSIKKSSKKIIKKMKCVITSFKRTIKNMPSIVIARIKKVTCSKCK